MAPWTISALPTPLLAKIALLLFSVVLSGARLQSSGPFQRQNSIYKVRRNAGRELTQGTESTPADFPYFVSLRVLNRHLCGGVLVKPDVVITAASCVVGPRAVRFPKVRSMFTDDLDPDSGSGEEFDVCTVIVHKEFDLGRLALGSDIAILLLNGSSVSTPVRMPSAGAEVSEGAELTLMGFRRLSNSRTSVFRAESLKAISNEVCDESYQTPVGVTEDGVSNVMCALATGALPPCLGDAGSPIVLDSGTLAGIMSFGPQDCFLVETPSVSTRVSEFLTFIDGLGGSVGIRSENSNCAS